MKRGIIFSVDATYAMIAIFFILSMLSFYYSGAANATGVAKKIGNETNDAAIVGFYTNRDGTELGLDDFGSISNQEFYECAQHKVFELTQGRGQSSLTQRKDYCRVIEWKKE